MGGFFNAGMFYIMCHNVCKKKKLKNLKKFKMFIEGDYTWDCGSNNKMHIKK